MAIGGTIRSIRRVMLWCICLSVLIICVMLKVSNVKRGYTELHRQADAIEARVQALEDR